MVMRTASIHGNWPRLRVTVVRELRDRGRGSGTHAFGLDYNFIFAIV